jgi:two-component system C4-dicarboxylate transport response regulator DctD
VSDLPGRVRGESAADRAGGAPVSDLARLTLAEAVAEATERLEKMMIVGRLAEQRGNRTATAESLGISRKTLFNKMRQYGLSGAEADDAPLG